MFVEIFKDLNREKSFQVAWQSPPRVVLAAQSAIKRGKSRLSRMAMTPTSPVSTPAKVEEKVHSGRVEKTRRKGDAKTPTYRIGGRTFACEACKKGHRVSKCTHAGERPLSMTNDPGRPSADQKRHCDCPKSCSCTKKNCKCERICNCTQMMYMLVYVPLSEGEDREVDTGGEWQIGKEVITDLKGKELSEEEIKNRAHLKSLQQNVKSRPRRLSQLPEQSLVSASSKAPKPEDENAKSSDETPPPVTCCQHKKKIVASSAPAKTELPTRERKKTQCDCGSGCNCAFCLDHPNNYTSQLIAQQQVTHFTEQGYNFPLGIGTSDLPWVPPQVNGSCMGTNPRFAMSSIPNPSPSQFQSLFPASNSTSQGYVLSYPIIRYTGTVHGHEDVATFVPIPAMEAPLAPVFFADQSNCNGQNLMMHPMMAYENTSPTFANLNPTQPLQPDYDIGDAVVADFHNSSGQIWSYGAPTHGVPRDDAWLPELNSPVGTVHIQHEGDNQKTPRSHSLSQAAQNAFELVPDLPSLGDSSTIYAAQNVKSNPQSGEFGPDLLRDLQYDENTDHYRSPHLPHATGTYT